MGLEPDTIYAKSEMTGKYYRVYEYDRVDSKRVVAKQKEEVEREEVPEEWLSRLDE